MNWFDRGIDLHAVGAILGFLFSPITDLYVYNRNVQKKLHAYNILITKKNKI